MVGLRAAAQAGVLYLYEVPDPNLVREDRSGSQVRRRPDHAASPHGRVFEPALRLDHDVVTEGRSVDDRADRDPATAADARPPSEGATRLQDGLLSNLDIGGCTSCPASTRRIITESRSTCSRREPDHQPHTITLSVGELLLGRIH